VRQPAALPITLDQGRERVSRHGMPPRNPRKTPIMTAAELAEIRERLGLTQEKMGEELGLTRRGYQYLESGSRTISRTIAKLSRLLAEIKDKET
jgi:DNA-binding XRE family transcriptional regulator